MDHPPSIYRTGEPFACPYTSEATNTTDSAERTSLPTQPATPTAPPSETWPFDTSETFSPSHKTKCMCPCSHSSGCSVQVGAPVAGITFMIGGVQWPIATWSSGESHNSVQNWGEGMMLAIRPLKNEETSSHRQPVQKRSFNSRVSEVTQQERLFEKEKANCPREQHPFRSLLNGDWRSRLPLASPGAETYRFD